MRARVLVGCVKIIIIIGCLAFPLRVYAKEAALLNTKGLIEPATLNYIENGLAYATAQGAELVILRLKTTGGLATSIKEPEVTHE